MDQLKGWVVTEAGGAIGVGRATQAIGKQGTVQIVGLAHSPKASATARWNTSSSGLRPVQR